MNNEEKNYKSLICFVVFPNPYKLHFKMIKGERTPILFESGGGQDASQWDSIATIVHQRLKATVITYDRAGFGQSSLDTLDYTILQEIKSLESALQKFGFSNEKLLLVGHSLGGFYNRVYAARHCSLTKYVDQLIEHSAIRKEMPKSSRADQIKGRQLSQM